MANPTTNLGMTKPTVGGSTDTWGTTLNENVVDIIDALFSISGTDVTMSDIKFNSVGVQETGAGTDTVKIQAPAAVTQYTLTMPGAVGASGQALRASDGAGALEWYTPADVGDITSVVAGAGMTGGGSSGAVTLDVIGTADKITVSADALTIASTYVGQTSITTLGTIATGVWEGTDIDAGQLAGSTLRATITGSSLTSVGTLTSLAVTGGGSLTGTWTDLGSVTTVAINGGTVDGTTIGASTASTGVFSQLSVDGTADAVQLLVQAHSTQTNELVIFENSAGTNLLEFTNAGNMELKTGTFQMANNVAIKMKESGGTARDILSLNISNVITIGNDSLATKVTGDLTVAGNLLAGTASDTSGIALKKDGGTGSVGLDLHNSGTNAADDVQINFETEGQIEWACGIDRTTGDWILGRNGTLGSNVGLTLSNAATPVATVNSLVLSGNITMADDTSIGISDSTERIEFDGAGDISVLGADLGVGLSAPVRPLQVVLADTEMVHFGGLSTNDAGEYCGIGLGQIDASGDYNKVCLVYEGNGSGSYFGKFHVLSSSTAGSGNATLSNIAFTIDNLQNTVIPAAKKLYLDGAAGVGGNTYISEYDDNKIEIVANAVRQIDIMVDETIFTQAATFEGSVSKASGSFKIDHPLPDKKDTHHLVHSFHEGPRADLWYRGEIALVSGSATVDLDEAAGMSGGTWDLLCRDPQVWIQNDTGWDAVRGSVSGSTLTIECSEATSTDTVSWMVVAERCDQHMIDTAWTDSEGRVIVEPEKALVV